MIKIHADGMKNVGIVGLSGMLAIALCVRMGILSTVTPTRSKALQLLILRDGPESTQVFRAWCTLVVQRANKSTSTSHKSPARLWGVLKYIYSVKNFARAVVLCWF